MPQQQSTLCHWFNKLLYDILFQPEDKVSDARIEDSLSAELEVQINGAHLKRTDWVDAVQQARLKSNLLLTSSEELLSSKQAKDGFEGTIGLSIVCQHINKATQVATESKGLVIATIIWEDGTRLLRSMTEIDTLG